MKLRRVAVLLVALIWVAALTGCEWFFAPQSEGSADNPVEIYVGIPYEGSIGRWGTSYYTFVTFATGSHTVAVTNTESDLHWDLWNSAWVLIASCQQVFGAGDEIDTVSLVEDQTYYLTVDENDWQAGNFTITVTFP